MKKILLLLICLTFCGTSVFADELSELGSMWDLFSEQQNNVGEKQFISDQDFEKAVESKQKKKKKDKNIPKGEMYRQSNETDFIIDTKKELPVLVIPLNLNIDDETLPMGHYQVLGEKINGSPVLKLYQAHHLMAQIPVTETHDDFNQAQINFVKLMGHSNDSIKIIFGNVDFNAYALVDIAQ